MRLKQQRIRVNMSGLDDGKEAVQETAMGSLHRRPDCVSRFRTGAPFLE